MRHVALCLNVILYTTHLCMLVVSQMSYLVCKEIGNNKVALSQAFPHEAKIWA